ncbi:sphingosine-1-phosphate phosphatase 2 isoform X2 [Corvus cornix cornix]|uniref:sphingosine-1-phosphate phosphatase 2 isoform X2 n=1 Tax=Corvus cornix cornix TaxID=932674 RepID=UPI0019512D0D|nr:sphingosine-1-phosphate phosphatase 2 isoform X2 [Corvus cornix cornix]XP_041898266.1 sphingosine-1-phosphate phosphatase 2 isoform X2 [Corvus kubaryi]
MARLLGTLRCSQPVARFQRSCGLFLAGDEGGGDPAEGPRDRGACNGAGALRCPAGAGRAPPGGVRSGRGPQSCTQKYIVKNYFYYYLFKFSAALGEEIFYITFLPFTYWNIDHSVSRRMIIVWSYPFELGLVAAFVFSTLVCLSRLYTGMHTVLDVIGGALISAVLLMLLYPAWDTIDHLLLTSPFCPLFSIVVPLVLCYNYPKLDYYSPTRGDTTTILGAAAGATVGFWLNNQYAAPAYTSKSFQPGFPLVTSTMVLVLARFFVGILVVLLTRWVMKSVVLGLLGYRYKFPIRDLEAQRRLEVEVPYKFVTYSTVGFTATVIVPLLHELLGLM